MKSYNILFTGANSMIAQTYLKTFGYKYNYRTGTYTSDIGYDSIILTSHSSRFSEQEGIWIEKLDVTNRDDIEYVLKSHSVDVVVNFAAMTDVDKCESTPDNVDAAYKVNALGPCYLAVACNKFGIRLIHLSTDFVFNKGLHEGSILDWDTRYEPVNFYGSAKLKGEQRVRHLCPNHAILRTSWVYGNGEGFVNKVISKLSAQALLGDDIKVVNDNVGTPTNSETVAYAIQHIIHDEYCNGTMHVSDNCVKSKFEFAKDIADMWVSFEAKITPVGSECFTDGAIRPINSALLTSRCLESALPDFTSHNDDFYYKRNLFYYLHGIPINGKNENVDEVKELFEQYLKEGHI